MGGLGICLGRSDTSGRGQKELARALMQKPRYMRGFCFLLTNVADLTT